MIISSPDFRKRPFLILVESQVPLIDACIQPVTTSAAISTSGRRKTQKRCVYEMFSRVCVYYLHSIDGFMLLEWKNQIRASYFRSSPFINSSVFLSSSSETNLNNITVSGWYRYDVLTSNIVNAPPVGTYFSGFLNVVASSDKTTSSVLQRFFHAGTDKKVFIRMHWQNAWSQWVKISSTE